MPTYDIFGNPIYSKEELKEIEVKKKAEEKAKAEAEQKKKAEAEQIAKYKNECVANLKLIEKSVKNTDALREDVLKITTSTTSKEEVEKIYSKYKDQVETAKKEKLEEEKKAKAAKEKAAKDAANPKYKYPFIIHYAGRNIDTDHMFEHGQEYTADQIRTRMLENQYYEFSGKVTFDYLEKDNVLLPIFAQHKKG